MAKAVDAARRALAATPKEHCMLASAQLSVARMISNLIMMSVDAQGDIGGDDAFELVREGRAMAFMAKESAEKSGDTRLAEMAAEILLPSQPLGQPASLRRAHIDAGDPLDREWGSSPLSGASNEAQGTSRTRPEVSVVGGDPVRGYFRAY